MIFDIKFRRPLDRKKFEKKYKLKRKDILVDEKTKCGGFAWAMLRIPDLQPIYNMGFIGYADPHEIINECKEAKINITFLAFLPINDKQAVWQKVRGRW